ncbi:MAG: leucine-rich repeat domain-containing protein, partial [Clostridia bacterium]|nr:leucine-rich repeat domain-containing protein [Clostridia bacterium]
TALKTVTFNCKEYTAIASAAFKNCTSLTDFTFPDSCNFVLEEAFAGCTSLTFTAPPKGVVFVGTRAFAGCTSLTEANMGEGCDTISNYAFENCTGLKKIYVGMDMAEISASAFVGCPNVEEIEIESTNKAFVLTANKMLKCRGTGHYVYSLLHEEIPLPEEATDAADSTSSETTQE